MMEAASTSETSVIFYQITQRSNPEDSHRHTRRRENLKSHDIQNIVDYLFFVDILLSNFWYSLVSGECPGLASSAAARLLKLEEYKENALLYNTTETYYCYN
jgi:hypothetical protein